MRIIFSSLLFCFLADVSVAQNCDIAQTGMAIYNNSNSAAVTTIARGQTANFRFSIKNLSTSNGCSIPAGSVTAVFDFPALAGGARPYIYNGAASFTSGYFTWSYNSIDEVLTGTNTMAIPAGAGDTDITINVKGNAAGAGSSNLNLTQGKGVADNASNNFTGAKLSVSATGSQPVSLTGFTATVDLCDASFTWKTSSENNFSHFEIEYSKDGVAFNKIGKTNGSNSVTGASYQFSYTQLNEEGYYRLKEAAIDGSYEYSNTIKVTTACHGKGKILVYPNPLNYAQKLRVNISGYTGKMTGELYNGLGQKTATYNLVNRVNELSVENLSAGSYMLKIKEDSGEVQSFKVIVTR